MNGYKHHRLLMAAILLTATWVTVPLARACPGCNATGLTLTEEMAAMDVAVIARLIDRPRATTAADAEAGVLPRARFEVSRVLKGETLARVGDKFETLYFGDGKQGAAFLIMGIDPPKLMWSTPLPLADRAIEYLTQVARLPKDGVARYVFFRDYLEDRDTMLARDAYDEFAKASYATVRSLKEHLRHDQLVEWIKNPEISVSHRRLYFVMLGICGGEADLPMLEEMITSSDRKQRQGLDMILFCYLTIRGEAGLPLIETSFLKNKESDYADTYAAIMALRFHADEGIVLQPKQVVPSLRLVLERPQLADLVIPDLARWEDWGAMDKLFELYKRADEKTSWVRVPVVNYLRVCPLPKAKELLAECERIDPQSVKRAITFFPTPFPAPVPAADKATRIEMPGRTTPRYVSTTSDAVPASFETPIPEPEGEPNALIQRASEPNTTVAKAAINGRPAPPVASINPGAAPAKALRISPAPRANLWQLLGVPLLAGAVLWFLQSSILRGRIGRG